MDAKIKLLARQTVDKIYRKIKREYKIDIHKFGTNVGIGADGTPTKYIDDIAEKIALSFIKKSKIPVNILSEEAGFVDFGGKYTFVLDPIDGTRNAYRGIPFFGVSLGVGKKYLEDIEYGVVRNIPTGDLFIAEKNNGAFLNNQRFAIPEIPSNDVLVSIALGINADDLAIDLAKKGKIRSLGAASLEMCMVAVGAFDYYIVSKEYLRITDIAASTLVIREAGGVVTNISGENLDMKISLDERTSVIACCNNELVKNLISLGKN
ncbi:MAG: inositol monophosphatase [Candidatus Thermoplasmatota archaeon]|nr:inositol monophosphatase [Candidatus Thermoplasmatota archaeon]